MTVRELMNQELFEVENEGTKLEQEITKPFCCDLLSIAMSRAPEGGAWVTVMGNINTLAVAALTDTALIVLAEDAVLDEAGSKKAVEEGVTVLKTSMPIFDAAMAIYQKL